MSLMMNAWVEVRIRSSVDAGELVSLLNDPAVQGAWQEPDMIHLYWPAARWNPDILQNLLAVLKDLGEREVEGRMTIDRLPDRDWNRLWVQSVEPIRVGRRVVIRPSWRPAELQFDDIELIIDPKQAFGTGHHATTRMLIEWLEEVIRGGESVLDVGTGSGILAMVALRLGAGRALGIDIDPIAVDCAREYAVMNGFGSELELETAALEQLDPQQHPAYDWVIANLDRGTLVDLAPAFGPYLRRGARVLLSGILVDQQAEVAGAFSAVGGHVGRVRERDGWLALEILAPDSCAGNDRMDRLVRPAVPHLHQINVSDGGVPKHPVPQAHISVHGVSGDRQRRPGIHGGPERAVCLYSLEVIEALRAEGHSIVPGSAGENLTLAGLDWAQLKPGDRLRVGERVRLEITDYAAPCEQNARWFLNGDYKRISHKRYPGWSRFYARVLAEGTVRTGDPVFIECVVGHQRSAEEQRVPFRAEG